MKILVEHDNPKLVHKVTKLSHVFNQGLKQLAHVPEIKIRKWMLRLWLNEQLNYLDTIYQFPEAVRTHLRCSIVSDYRDEIRNIKEKKQ